MSTEVEQLIEKVRTLPPEQQREVAKLVESFEAQGEPPAKTIWEKIQEHSESVPLEDWEAMPSDGSINLDHYLYGSPKK